MINNSSVLFMLLYPIQLPYSLLIVEPVMLQSELRVLAKSQLHLPPTKTKPTGQLLVFTLIVSEFRLLGSFKSSFPFGIPALKTCKT